MSNLYEFFLDRNTRTFKLSEEARMQLRAASQLDENPSAYEDRYFSSLYISSKYGHEHKDVFENFGAYANQYYQTDNPAQVYDKISVFARQANERGIKNGYQHARNIPATWSETGYRMLGGLTEQFAAALPVFIKIGQTPHFPMIPIQTQVKPIQIPREDIEASQAVVRGVSKELLSLAEGSAEAYGVSDEFRATFAGKFNSAISALPIYMVSAMSGPAGLLAIESDAYGAAVMDYRNTVPEDQRNAEDEIKYATSFAIASTVLERFGASEIVNAVFKNTGKMTAKEALKRIIMAPQGEGITEGLQGLAQDALAAGIFDEDRELFTPEAFMKRLEEYVIGVIAGEAVTAPSVAAQAVMQRNAKVAAQDGGPLEINDLEILRRNMTDEQIMEAHRETQESLEKGKQLVAALNGDPEALDAYNEEWLEPKLEGEKQQDVPQPDQPILDVEAKMENIVDPEEMQMLEDVDYEAPTAQEEALYEAELQEELAQMDEIDLIAEEAIATEISSELVDKVNDMTVAETRLAEEDVRRGLGMKPMEASKYRALKRLVDRQNEIRSVKEKGEANVRREQERAQDISNAKQNTINRLKSQIIRNRNRWTADKAYLKVKAAEARVRYEERLLEQRRKTQQRLDKARKQRDKAVAREVEKRTKQVGKLKNLRDAIQRLNRIAQTVPVRLRGKLLGEFSKLSSIKGTEAQSKALQGAIQRANKIVSEDMRKNAVSRIQKKIERAEKMLKDAESRKRRSLFTWEQWQYVRDLFLVEDDATIKDLSEQIDRQLSSANEDSDIVDDLISQLERIQRPNLKDPEIPMSSLLRIEEEIDSLFNYGRTLEQARKKYEAEKFEKDATESSIEVDRHSNSRGIDPKKGILDKESPLKRKYKSLLNAFTSAETMIEIAAGKALGKLHDVVLQPIFDAADHRAKLNRKFADFMEGLRKKHDFDYKSAADNIILVKNGIQIDGVAAMTIYGYAKNERARMSLNNTDIGGNIKITDGLVSDIEERLPDNYKTAIDELITFLDTEYRPMVADFFMDKYGIEMPIEENYLPLNTLEFNNPSKDLFAEVGKMVSFKRGHEKARSKEKAAPFNKLNVFDSVFRHVNNVNHVVALEPAVMYSQKILSDKRVKDAIDRVDPTIHQHLMKYLNRVAGNGYKNTDLDKYIGYIRRNAAMAFTSVNLASWLKVPMSMSVASQFIDKASLAETATEFANPSKAMEMIRFSNESSEFVSNIENTYNREYLEMVQSEGFLSAVGARGMHEKIRDMSYSVHKAMTKANVVISWTAKYRQVLNETKSHYEAVKQADAMIRKTQPTGRVEDLPEAYVSGELAKALTMFTIDINKNFNILRATLAKKDNGQALLAFVGYSILVPAIIGAISDVANDEAKRLLGLKPRVDPEELAKQLGRDTMRYASTQVVGTFPILSQVIEGAAANLSGDKSEGYWLARRSSPIYASAQSMLQGDIATGTGILIGAPGVMYWGRPTDRKMDDLIEEWLKEFED